MENIIGIGEVLWDEFENYKRPGGAPANVAYHANLLGSNGIIASKLGNDDAGHDLIRFLQRKKIPITWIQRTDNVPSGRVSVKMKGSEASYTIHENVAWDELEYTSQWKKLAAETDAVCFGSLAQRSKSTANTIRAFLDDCGENVLKVFDINVRPPYINKEVITESLKRANVIKLNEKEFKDLPGLLESSKSTRELLFDEFSLKVICYTKGADGCEIITPDAHFIEGQAQVDTSQGDSVGVGDSFTAALIHNKLKGRGWNEALSLANLYAANIAALKGAMPDVSKRIITEVQ